MFDTDYDTELEAARVMSDHMEKPEPVLPEKNSEEWWEALDAAFKDIVERDGDLIAGYILDGKPIPESIRKQLYQALDEELEKRAK